MPNRSIDYEGILRDSQGQCFKICLSVEGYDDPNVWVFALDEPIDPNTEVSKVWLPENLEDITSGFAEDLLS
jgi:hypothetical protein